MELRGSPAFDNIVVVIVQGVGIITAKHIRDKELPSHAEVQGLAGVSSVIFYSADAH